MKLIVGLGNPGIKYELTRHNIGFILLDLFADKFGIKFREGKGDWYEGNGEIRGEDVYLMKPVTYMNNSGVAIREFREKYDVDVKDILVVVDDFQIPLGTIRVRRDGSDGGHNGLASIIYNLETDEFPRMRVGIGPGDLIRKDEYIDFVLGNFEQEEIDIIKEIVPEYNNCIISFITDGITRTMNIYNKSFLKKEEDIQNKDPEENKES